MQKWRSWEAASEAEWGLAVEREMVIRPLAEQERLSTAAIQDAIGRLGLSRSVLYDLVAATGVGSRPRPCSPGSEAAGSECTCWRRRARNCCRRAFESST